MSKKPPISSKPNHETDDDLIFNDDVLDVEEEKWWWVFQNPFGLVVIIALCIILSVGLWFVFQGSSPVIADGSDNDGVRIIKANPEPYKVPPAEEDENSVDNQDKEVFKRLKHEENKHSAEPVTSAPKQDVEQPMEVHKLPDQKVVQPELKPEKEEIKESPKIKISKPELEKSTEVKLEQKVMTKSTPKKLTGGLYMIRVASFRKPETAERELTRVISLLPQEHRSVGREVRRIDSETGAFYVALMGAFSSLTEAKALVALLKDKNCAVVIQKVKQK